MLFRVFSDDAHSVSRAVSSHLIMLCHLFSHCCSQAFAYSSCCVTMNSAVRRTDGRAILCEARVEVLQSNHYDVSSCI